MLAMKQLVYCYKTFVVSIAVQTRYVRTPANALVRTKEVSVLKTRIIPSSDVAPSSIEKTCCRQEAQDS